MSQHAHGAHQEGIARPRIHIARPQHDELPRLGRGKMRKINVEMKIETVALDASDTGSEIIRGEILAQGAAPSSTAQSLTQAAALLSG